MLPHPPCKIDQYSSPQAVKALLSLVTFTEPILDCTYGNGRFWVGSTRTIIGCDRAYGRARDCCCSFLALPFRDGSFELVVYDPPFHPSVHSHEEARFGSLGRNEIELKQLFVRGLHETWRVSGKYLLVKCQDYIHNHHPQWMPLWCVAELGEPYEWLIATRPSKLVSGRWTQVKSLRRQHADYILFSKVGLHR